jgi:hypothetical protein
MAVREAPENLLGTTLGPWIGCGKAAETVLKR